MYHDCLWLGYSLILGNVFSWEEKEIFIRIWWIKLMPLVGQTLTTIEQLH